MTRIALRRPATNALPQALRHSFESMSGIDLSDVRVHRASPRPAAVDALAYTSGSEIHLGPGQDQHLAHEAWHVVQQKQGRVRANGTIGGQPLNDDRGLEAEADRAARQALPAKDEMHPVPLARRSVTGAMQRFSKKTSLTINGISIPGWLLLSWFTNVTRATLPQFFAGTPEYDALPIQEEPENLDAAAGPGSWLNAIATIGKRNAKALVDAEKLSKEDRQKREIIGRIAVGDRGYAVERGLWIKPEDKEVAPRYTDVARGLQTRPGDVDEAAGHGTNIRRILGGDAGGTTEEEREAALAMFGAEQARNPRTYGTGLMLLDLVEGRVPYGSGGGKFLTWDRILTGGRRAEETPRDFGERKIGPGPVEPVVPPVEPGKRRVKAPPPPSLNQVVGEEPNARWQAALRALRESPALAGRENAEGRKILRRAMDRENFGEYWSGKFPMSPKFSETLGAEPLRMANVADVQAGQARPGANLNVVQEKEVALLIRWLGHVLTPEMTKDVRTVLEAKALIENTFRTRLGAPGKMGKTIVPRQDASQDMRSFEPPNRQPLPNPWTAPSPETTAYAEDLAEHGAGAAYWRQIDRHVQSIGANEEGLYDFLSLLRPADLLRLATEYQRDLDLVLGYPERVDEDTQRMALEVIRRLRVERRF